MRFMSRPARSIEIVWTGSRPPTKSEKRAIARAARAGRLHQGDRVSPARGAFARANPSPSSPAAHAYREFHWGERPTKQQRVHVPRQREVFALGELAAVEYIASKGRERARWHHKFRRPRPILTADASGRLGPIIGGNARVTERGIEG